MSSKPVQTATFAHYDGVAAFMHQHNAPNQCCLVTVKPDHFIVDLYQDIVFDDQDTLSSHTYQ